MPPKGGKSIKKSSTVAATNAYPEKKYKSGKAERGKGMKRNESYATYIYKVMKRFHPDTRVSS